jgi:hypothetical protein
VAGEAPPHLAMTDAEPTDQIMVVVSKVVPFAIAAAETYEYLTGK